MLVSPEDIQLWAACWLIKKWQLSRTSGPDGQMSYGHEKISQIPNWEEYESYFKVAFNLISILLSKLIKHQSKAEIWITVYTHNSLRGCITLQMSILNLKRSKGSNFKNCKSRGFNREHVELASSQKYIKNGSTNGTIFTEYLLITRPQTPERTRKIY